MKSHLKLFNLSHEHEADISHLIGGILVRKGVVLVVGAYGTGKTQAVMRMASSIAVGAAFGYGKIAAEDEVFDFCCPHEQGYTLYFAGEGKANVMGRIKAAKLALSEQERKQLDDMYGGKLPIIPINVEIPLSGTDQIEEVDKLIEQARQQIPNLLGNPKLIIFDTLSATFLLKDENNNSEMQRLYRTLDAYAEHYNCCVVAVAHPPKSNDARRGYSRGASAIPNSADVILEISKVNGSSQRKVRVQKMRDGQYQDGTVRFKVQDYGASPAFVPLDPKEDKTDKKDSQAKGLNDRQANIINILKSCPGIGKLQTGIIKEIVSMQPDCKNLATEKRLYRRAIESLADMGLVRTYKVGSRVIVQITETVSDDMNDVDQEFFDEDENDFYNGNDEGYCSN